MACVRGVGARAYALADSCIGGPADRLRERASPFRQQAGWVPLLGGVGVLNRPPLTQHVDPALSRIRTYLRVLDWSTKTLVAANDDIRGRSVTKPCPLTAQPQPVLFPQLEHV